MLKKNNKSSMVLSTEVFKDKENIPAFIKDHHMFKNPVKIQKVFPSIGLSNYREKCNITKPLFDFKKENAFVHQLLSKMVSMIMAIRDSAMPLADKMQFFALKEDRENSREKISGLYELVHLCNALVEKINPKTPGVLEAVACIEDGKIVLRLPSGVADVHGKNILKKGASLFKIFGKLHKSCTELGVPFEPLEQTPEFKTFSKENVANKEYNVIFSSSGNEGAWDILTMSMRGITSCQRWDGEYPRCLIGSILSKFVGIIYLTSGTDIDMESKDKKINFGKSPKMMRRSIVRYAIDADEGKPCILIDKMYPDIDKEILNVFVESLKSKTSLPVYYAPDIKTQTRHIYSPSEKIRTELFEKECSYQDTPLKSKLEFEMFTLNNRKGERDREIQAFKFNMEMYISNIFDKEIDRHAFDKTEVNKIIHNIMINGHTNTFITNITNHIFSMYRPPARGSFDDKSYHRKYLMQFILSKNTMKSSAKPGIISFIKTSTSREFKTDEIYEFIISNIFSFAKQQLKNLSN